MQEVVAWICKCCRFQSHDNDAKSCPQCGNNKEEEEKINEYMRC